MTNRRHNCACKM